MKYFKVKPEADQTKISANGILVKNELYTTNDILLCSRLPLFDMRHFDEIEVNKNDTYFFFGARFCTQYPYNS